MFRYVRQEETPKYMCSVSSANMAGLSLFQQVLLCYWLPLLATQLPEKPSDRYAAPPCHKFSPTTDRNLPRQPVNITIGHIFPARRNDKQSRKPRLTSSALELLQSFPWNPNPI